MGLQDALRKAAGLLVELPPEEAEERLSDIEDAAIADSYDTSPDNGPVASRFGIPVKTREDSGEAKTVEQIVREADGPNLDEIDVAATTANATAAGSVAPAAIYAAAKLPAAAFSAEQMLEMLQSLPQELPLDTKRQTVKVTLSALGKTMGATPESIVADASRKMAALAAYENHLSKRTQEFITTTENDIATLQSQIEEKRKAILDTRQNLTQSTHMCEAESDRLDDVLEFFSLDVPPSKYAAAGSGAPEAAKN